MTTTQAAIQMLALFTGLIVIGGVTVVALLFFLAWAFDEVMKYLKAFRVLLCYIYYRKYINRMLIEKGYASRHNLLIDEIAEPAPDETKKDDLPS